MPPKKRGRPPGSKKMKSLICKTTIDGDGDEFIAISIPPVVAKEKRKVYNCSVCQNKNFKMKKKYELHLLKEHSVTPGSIPREKCHVVCPDKETLEEHMKVHDIPTIKCEHCSKQFTCHAHVLRHMAQRGCGKKMAKFPCERLQINLFVISVVKSHILGLQCQNIMKFMEKRSMLVMCVGTAHTPWR